MTLPRGTIRQALSVAATEIAIERGAGFTWRDVAQRAQVGWAAARQGVKDMARAGELHRVGCEQRPEARRPMTLFVPAERGSSTVPLDTLLRTWLR